MVCSEMRELLEEAASEAGTNLARELAVGYFAAHERAVLYQSRNLRVLQSRSGVGPEASFKRWAGAFL